MTLSGLVESAKREANAKQLEGFFDNHFAFRKKVWEYSGNRHLRDTLEWLVIPLYSLYLIRQSYNREGIHQTIGECIAYQNRVLDAFGRRDADSARQDARDFLLHRKQFLGTWLVPNIPEDA